MVRRPGPCTSTRPSSPALPAPHGLRGRGASVGARLATLPARLGARLPRWTRSALLCAAAAAGCGSAMAGDVLDRVQSARTLRACLWHGYDSIAYRDPRSGLARSLDLDLASAFAGDLRVQLVQIESHFSSFTDDLLADRCDIAMFAIADTDERRRQVRFSLPLLRGGLIGVAARGSAVVRDWADIDRDGVRVGVQRDGYLEPVLRAWLRHATLVVLESRENREDELQAGRIDVLITDLPYGRRLIDSADWARVLVPPRPFHPVTYAYAVRPGDDAWLRTVDAFITRIRHDGRLAAAARQHHLTDVMLPQ